MPYYMYSNDKITKILFRKNLNMIVRELITAGMPRCVNSVAMVISEVFSFFQCR